MPEPTHLVIKGINKQERTYPINKTNLNLASKDLIEGNIEGVNGALREKYLKEISKLLKLIKRKGYE